MSFRPTERLEAEYSNVEVPSTDVELKTKEAKIFFYYLILFSGIDYILSGLLIIYSSNFFYSDIENNILLFAIKFISLTLFYVIILVCFVFLKLRLTKVIKIIYIIVAILYFLYEFIQNIIHINEVDEGWIEITFLIISFLVIIPRLLFFCYIGSLIKKLNEVQEYAEGEDHDKFRENLENKMERGADTNWSKVSLTHKNSGEIKNKLNKNDNEEEEVIKENQVEYEKELNKEEEEKGN